MKQRLHAQIVVVLALAASMVVACSPAKGPLADLSPDDRTFLFAGTDTHAPFLGQPIDHGPLNCYPQRMNQGYVLVDEDKTLYLDSIRPSGIERHTILSVATTDDGFEVKAKNGVSAPFSLIFTRTGPDRAMISWDGAPAEAYRRCERPGD